MDVEINNVIYMELNSGPKIANSTCGKTMDVETIDRDSTVIIGGEGHVAHMEDRRGAYRVLVG